MEQSENIKIHERLTTLEGSMKTVYNRVDDAEIEIKEIRSDNKILHEMNTNIGILATEFKHQGKRIESIESDVKELKDKPSKRMNALETIIITVVATGIVTYALSKIFGG